MRITLSFSFCLLLLFYGCTSNPPENQTRVKDSTLVNENIPVQKLITLFKNELTLPFAVDSGFLAKEKFGDSLGTGEVQLLTGNWFKHELVEPMEYEIKEFYKIDSIKVTGTYPSWSEKLDIGMTKYANAYAIGKIKLTDNVELLVWAFKMSSYEACPWSSETSVYFTIIKYSAMGESFILGETFGTGDAPVWMTRDIYGTLDAAGTLDLKYKQINDDADGTETEVEEGRYTFAVKDGSIQLMKQEKGKPYKVPHPKEKE
jgi:hypothetical protein